MTKGLVNYPANDGKKRKLFRYNYFFLFSLYFSYRTKLISGPTDFRVVEHWGSDRGRSMLASVGIHNTSGGSLLQSPTSSAGQTSSFSSSFHQMQFTASANVCTSPNGGASSTPSPTTHLHHGNGSANNTNDHSFNGSNAWNI